MAKMYEGTKRRHFFPITEEDMAPIEMAPIFISLSASFLSILLLQVFLLAHNRQLSDGSLFSSSDGVWGTLIYILVFLSCSWVFLSCFIICLGFLRLKKIRGQTRTVVAILIGALSILSFLFIFLYPKINIDLKFLPFLSRQAVGSYLSATASANDSNALLSSLSSLCTIFSLISQMYVNFGRKGFFTSVAIITIALFLPWLFISGDLSSPSPSEVPDISSLSLKHYDGDETTLDRVQIISTEGSSRLHDKTNNIYFNPMEVLTDDFPWIEGVYGNGTGEIDGTKATPKQWIKLLFPSKVKIDVLGLHLGYADPEHYSAMNRPRRLEFEFSDGSTAEYEFLDQNEMQYVQLSTSVETRSVKITLLSVYPGRDTHGTAITSPNISQTCISRVKAFRFP